MKCKFLVYLLLTVLLASFFVQFYNPVAFCDVTFFWDGFEGSSSNFVAWTGNNTAGVGSSATVESVNPHHGTYNAKFVASTGSGYAQAYKSGLTSSAIYYVQGYYKFDGSLPSSEGDRLQLGLVCSTTYSYGATIEIKYTSGARYWGITSFEASVEQDNYEASASNPTTANWYYIQLKRDVTGDSIQLWVNGTSKLTVSRSITSNNNYVDVGIGWKNYASTATTYVDDVLVSSAPISVEETGPNYYVDLDYTDVDSSADKGTQSNFTASSMDQI